MNGTMNPVMDMLRVLGCEDKAKLDLAYHIYMELSEVMVLWDIGHHYNKKLDIIYFSAKRSKNSEVTELFVPHPEHKPFTLEWIKSVQDEICKDENKGFSLAIMHQDSTVVIYSLSEGLHAPDSPETARLKKLDQDRRRKNNTELQRQVPDLFEQAMVSISSDEEL